MKKKVYEKPSMQLITAMSMDVICTSGILSKGGSEDDLDTTEDGYVIAE